MQTPDRKTIAAGLTAIAGWAIVTFALPALGVPAGLITAPEATAVIGTLATLVGHFTPASLNDVAKRLNTTVEEVAKIIPQTYAEYPKTPQADCILTTKDGQQVN